MFRSAVVAGQFYPGQKENLYATVSSLISTAAPEKPSIGLMSPHAGYIYSGEVAGLTFSGVKIPDEIILLGPNHHGRGHLAAVCSDGEWETPLGRTTISSALAGRILAECPMTAEDSVAHRYEHSLEVQLPFLQFRAPQASIVPICIGHLSLGVLLQLGDGVAQRGEQRAPPFELADVGEAQLFHRPVCLCWSQVRI